MDIPKHIAVPPVTVQDLKAGYNIVLNNLRTLATSTPVCEEAIRGGQVFNNHIQDVEKGLVRITPIM